MERKKIRKYIIISLALIIYTVLLIAIIKNNNVTTITKHEDVGKAMPESTEIADLQKQIERLQKENEDLAAEISKATAAGDKVLSGEKVWTNGNIEEGTMANNGELNWSPTTGTTFTIPAGYYSGGTLDSTGVYEAGKTDGDIKHTVTIYFPAHSSTMTVSASGLWSHTWDIYDESGTRYSYTV